ncbi:AmiS/UreI family transporter [Polaromonas glacialis]|uniref:AmiS/UreI family transporter n=1 Tax=Polaromonas glacialis TaxID=866564 RepID=UPI0004963919|nr:AmiS/UreI family transporter [Polaromonas glacialis]
MLLGLVLFYVGAVLILNGLWMLGHIGDREIWVINLFVGAVSLLVALSQAFGAAADAASIRAAALSLLFSLTYLWVAINRFTGADGRGLGWFSLFVAITAVPVATNTFRTAEHIWDVWSGLSWAAWAVLWFVFFLQLVLRKQVVRMAAWMAIGEGILTGWVPGYLLLTGVIASP